MFPSPSYSYFEIDFEINPFRNWEMADSLIQEPEFNDFEQTHYEDLNHKECAKTPQIEEELFDVVNFQKFPFEMNQKKYSNEWPQSRLQKKVFDINEENPIIIDQQSAQSIKLPKRKRKKPYVKPQRKLFNNMPGFLISSIQKLVPSILFDGLETNYLQKLLEIQTCFEELKKLLMKVSSKLGNRKHLRMILNDINKKLNKQLRKSKQLNKAEIMYFYILTIYPQQVINQAKRILRLVISRHMTREWIIECVQVRRFSGKAEEKKEIFQKYMKYFRKELFEGQIGISIDKEEVLAISLFQN